MSIFCFGRLNLLIITLLVGGQILKLIILGIGLSPFGLD